MKRLVLAVTLVAGCGGAGGDESSGLLDGTWGLTVGACVEARSFNGGKYATILGCPDANGVTLNADMEQGMYTVDGNHINFVPTETSCPANVSSARYYIVFAASASSLVLTFTDGSDVYTRLGDSNATGTSRFGCFMDGVFTPGSVVPYP